MVFQEGDPKERIPITFSVYLILTEEKKILVDAGCHTMPNFEMKNFTSTAAVLKEMGIEPAEITDLILTHAHHDHCEAAKDFKNATIRITQAALPKAQKHLPEQAKVEPFEKEYRLTPQIKLVEWGGHAVGSCIVEIQTDDITHILAGDECYTNTNIQKKICTGSFKNQEKAIEFIQKFSAEQYCVHTCHDNTLQTERIL